MVNGLLLIWTLQTKDILRGACVSYFVLPLSNLINLFQQLQREFVAIIKKELPDVDLSNLFDKALVKFTGLAIKIEQVAKLESKGNQVLGSLIEEHTVELEHFKGKI